MAYRRRYRRGSRGIWFPVIGNTFTQLSISENGSALTTADDTFRLLYGDTGYPINNITGFGTTLADYTTTAFLTKRIVGTCHAAIAQGADSDVVNALVGVGIYVDRVDQAGVPQNALAWNPFDEGGKQKRWLWQRHWILTNSANGPIDQTTDFPHSNAEYGDIRSGPHVDCKAKARVSYEEGLFITCWARAVEWINGVEDPDNTDILIWFNLRMFGTIIRAGNR